MNELHAARRLNQVHQRMLGSKRIPNRKDRIVGLPFGRLMDIVVNAAIAPVYVLIYGRIDHRMIQGRVEYGFRIIVGFYTDAAQLLLPLRLRSLPNFIE